MRVLLISSSSGSHGGGELYLAGLAEGLNASGVDVHIAMSMHERMDPLATTLRDMGTVHRLPIRNTYDQKLRVVGSVISHTSDAALKKLVTEVQPCLLHLNKQNLEDGLDLLRACCRLAVPAVSTIHVTRSAASLGAKAASIRDAIARNRLNRDSFSVICVAEQCRQDFLQFMGGRFNASDCYSVPNGVAAQATSDRESIREKWGCKENDFVLGTIARIEEQKNPLLIPKVLSNLPENYKFVWVGEGRLREQLENAVLERNLTDRFLITGWQNEARRLLSGFDLFTLPSRYEGFPFAILEAMAASLPCVVSDVDGVRESVKDGVSGYLCTGDSIERWVSCIRGFGDDPGKLDRFGKAGFERWRQRFSLEAMTNGTINVYENALRVAQR